MQQETQAQLQKALARQEEKAAETAKATAAAVQKQVWEKVSGLAKMLEATERRYSELHESSEKAHRTRLEEQMTMLRRSESEAMETHRRAAQAMQRHEAETVAALKAQLQREEASHARIAEVTEMRHFVEREREDRRIEEQGYWRRLLEASEKERRIQDENCQLVFDLQKMRDAADRKNDDLRRKEFEWQVERRELEVRAENRELEWRAECHQVAWEADWKAVQQLEADAQVQGPLRQSKPSASNWRSRVKGKLQSDLALSRDMQYEDIPPPAPAARQRPQSAGNQRLAATKTPAYMAKRHSQPSLHLDPDILAIGQSRDRPAQRARSDVGSASPRGSDAGKDPLGPQRSSMTTDAGDDLLGQRLSRTSLTASTYKQLGSAYPSRRPSVNGKDIKVAASRSQPKARGQSATYPFAAARGKLQSQQVSPLSLQTVCRAYPEVSQFLSSGGRGP
mmetsp:Transcript_7266/g.15881  ORF Transcript_7266/g.15881 Transcript_7266/m.15881 type:complete len:452 (+) Transcript_7266:1-1356(+)